MVVNIYPDSGATILGADWHEYFHFIGDHVANGLTATFTSSVLTIANGRCVIDGINVESDSVETFANTSGNSWIYAQVEYTGTEPTSGSINETTTQSVATGANKLLLLSVDRTGTTINSITYNEGIYQLLIKHGVDAIGINKTGSVLSINAVGSGDQDIKLVSGGSGVVTGNVETLSINLSDLTTAFTTGIKNFFVAPKDGKFTDMYGIVYTATGSATLKFDVKNNGSSILDSTKLSFANASKISNKATFGTGEDSFSSGDIITFEINATDSTARGGIIRALMHYT